MEERDNTIEQTYINNKLQEIAEMLKTISRIGKSYVEYLGALIYAMTFDRKDFNNFRTGNGLKIVHIIYKIDEKFKDIREMELSRRLFNNISFVQAVREEDYITFEGVVNKLNDLIREVYLIKDEQAKFAEAFEYVIMKAAENNEIPNMNNEFYTPNEIISTMIGLLTVNKNDAIYNPACGTGNFFTQVAKNCNIYAFGNEENISNYNICITNLWLHKVYGKRIKESIEANKQFADIAIANPPFSSINDNGIINENLYYKYGISEKSSSYTKFLAIMLESVNEKGKVSIILPHGFLFKKANSEKFFREELIEKNYIDAIIGLPEKLFHNTKIPVIILLLDKAKKNKDVLFIDASKEYINKRKNNVLSDEMQEKIKSTYNERKVIPGYSYIANCEEIRKNNYDLSIMRYVKTENNFKYSDEEKIEDNLDKLYSELHKVEGEIKELISNTKNIL